MQAKIKWFGAIIQVRVIKFCGQINVYMKQLLLDINIPAVPSLANFVPGRNCELLQLLKKIIRNQEQENFVYIWGGLGCGKSHLLQAVINAFLKKNQAAAIYLPCEIFPFSQISNDVQYVAIDDVEQLDEQSQIKLFNLYNQMRDKESAFMLVSGRVAPAQLNARQDLVTRLGWGLVYQVHELSEDEKLQALRSHALDRGIDLPGEIGQYLLRHNSRDLPSLMMTLDALDRYSLVHRRRITIPLLKKLLQEEQ